MSYGQYQPYYGALNSGHRGPSCSLVQSLIRNPCPLNWVGNIDCSSYIYIHIYLGFKVVVWEPL